MPRFVWAWSVSLLVATPGLAAVNAQGELLLERSPAVAAPAPQRRLYDGGDFVIRVPDNWYAVGSQIPLGEATGRVIFNFGPQWDTQGGLTVITEPAQGRTLAEIVASGKAQQRDAIVRFNQKCDCVSLVDDAFHDMSGGYWYDYRLHGQMRRGHDFYHMAGDRVFLLHIFHHPNALSEREVEAIASSLKIRS